MIESTPSDYTPQSSRWCVVYDDRDGRVVHVHEFIGEPPCGERDSLEEYARVALETARRFHQPGHLRVLHVPAGFEIQDRARYRVDAQSGEIVAVSRSGHSFGAFVEAREKRRGKTATRTAPRRKA
jgi:hypothetical protein